MNEAKQQDPFREMSNKEKTLAVAEKMWSYIEYLCDEEALDARTFFRKYGLWPNSFDSREAAANMRLVVCIKMDYEQLHALHVPHAHVAKGGGK